MSITAPPTSKDPSPASPPVTEKLRPDLGQALVTGSLVLAPVVAIAVVVPVLWGRAVNVSDLVMAAVLYLVTGYGVTIGFHRMLTHGSFRAKRGLKIALAVAGSMAIQGSATGWVANHRRHHMYSDRPGDPHSPHRYGSGWLAQFRGLLWAHVGWLFLSDPTSAEQFAPDLVADRDLEIVSRLFPVWAAASLAIPFCIGWALSGSMIGAVTALVWAGIVRMAALHHVTWSVNSICHVFGRRPFATYDRSANVAVFALVSLGESWHNFHHAFPSCARFGALGHQVDSSAALIRLFEKLGWATKVRWPNPARLGVASFG